jgi:hypothetical protein
MITISGPWLDPEKERPVFTALPLLAALLPIVGEAHEGLLNAQRRGAGLQQQIKALIDKGVELDTRHDRKMRGAYNYLGSIDEMTDDPALAAAVRELRDRLVPAGLKATIRSYTDQAGDARMLPSRLDEASRKLLRELETPEGPLSDVVDDWIATALELEKVDAQRVELEKLAKSGADGITSRDVLNARNAWIRAVRAVETNLELEKGATDEIVDRLLGRLRREEAKAERRARKAGAGGEAAGADDEAEEDDGAEAPTNAEPKAEP